VSGRYASPQSRRSIGGYVSPYNIARVYGAIDDMPRALERLVSAYREHNPDLIELTHEPSFAGLHSNAKKCLPRHLRLAESVNELVSLPPDRRVED
jgi:hypothetical protein